MNMQPDADAETWYWVWYCRKCGGPWRILLKPCHFRCRTCGYTFWTP